MKFRVAVALTIGLAAAACAAAQPVDESVLDPDGYAGSVRCAQCHPEKYEGWSQTFHATVVQDARTNPDAVLGDFDQPGLGFTRDDVEYTIGGHRDQRYMKKIGDDYYVLPKLWSVSSQRWRPYNVWIWRSRPYSTSCKGCHVTGYDPNGHVPVAEHRIGCEACHGPGWDHAISAGRQPIVHPAKLPEDRRKMICAACHVRGKDKSGLYEFPVGYLPGEDLGAYYVPTKDGAYYIPTKELDGKTNSEAIVIVFDAWKENWEKYGGGPCEACGLKGPMGEGKEGEEPAEPGPMDLCQRCHAFGELYAEHTHHPASANVLCFDCHRKQDFPIDAPVKLDIHTPQYFLQHANDCYDHRFEPACLGCHPTQTPEWATRCVERWRKPREIDH